jgi:hypothetical protein
VSAQLSPEIMQDSVVHLIAVLADPIMRRVRHMPSDFFLLTNWFICDPRMMGSSGCAIIAQSLYLGS